MEFTPSRYCCAMRHFGSQEVWRVSVVMWTIEIVESDAEVSIKRSRRRTKRVGSNIAV
jgi:hypothetical protein